MIRRILPLALCIAAVAAIGAAPAGAAERTTPEGVPVPRLDWRDCDDGFQCATAEVPRDDSRPHGAQVRLALIRHPAVDQEHRIGSLLLNPGGPGGSGVGFVRLAPPPAFQLLSRFDWVGFDPRGVGQSEPAIDCDEGAAAPLMTPDTLDVPALLKRGRERAELCLNRDPAFLASVNTGNTARDMDVLRAAVGDPKLSYYGLSWGGVLGETYAGLFPGRARALALDSSGDARLLTFHGDGHGVIPQFNGCVLGHLRAYLHDLVVPPAGASCRQATGAAQSTALASTRWTSGWWYTGYSWSPGLK